MPDKIKPSEVSEVLFRELQDIQDDIQYEEVGKVLQVSDGTARIYGLKNATANELLEFENGTMAIVFNLEEDNVGVVLMGPSENIKEGDTVKRTGRIASIEVSTEMLGRVINTPLFLKVCYLFLSYSTTNHDCTNLYMLCK